MGRAPVSYSIASKVVFRPHSDTVVTESSETLGRTLKDRGETIAVAETTTGGIISSKIVSVSGSYVYFDQGIVAYSKTSKIETLGLDPAVLDEFGAVSAEAAKALAEAVRSMSGATYGLAETGIAGPIRGRSPKPVGAAYIALAGPDGTRVIDVELRGDREKIRAGIAEKALEFTVESLAKFVSQKGSKPTGC